MRSRFALIMLACLAGAGGIGALSGVHAALETLALLLAVSATALAAALADSRARVSVGPLSRQLALAVAIALGAMLIAVWAAAAIMFISSEDARLISIIAAVVAVVGVCVAAVLTDPLVGDIERLRDRVRAVAAGERRTDLELAGSRELAELARATNTTIAQLASEETARHAAEEARQRLIVALSHDLRTPIASLQVLTEAIQDRIATGATRTRYMREMQTHVAILTALADDLFELIGAEANGAPPSTAAVEIGELASETVAAMQATGEKRGVTLRALPDAGHTPGSPLLARADADQIRRVLLNLLENAIRHTPRGGEVVVHTTRVETNVEVEVADTGTGIVDTDRERVFEAFFRGTEHTSRSEKGTGLGLAIARAIVVAHGGRIWLAPSQRGTRVRFSLPALEHIPVARRDVSTASITQPQL